MPTSASPLPSLDRSLQRLRAQPHFVVRELRFPNYKGLELSARLPFDFPVTALLGENGTNKSSILHALQGCPKGATVADFWFETHVDQIPEERDGLKQSVVHSYESAKGHLVSCIKSRAPRGASDPDYWEAVKPTQKYGFGPGEKRYPPVDAEVIHLDFRGELPAFDKYFYFPDEQHLERRRRYAREKARFRREYRKQDYLRARSKRLKTLLKNDGVPLPGPQLAVLRYILGREYARATILQHGLYRGHSGSTIVFSSKDSDGDYSDAFAGSGESAACLLVHRLMSAPKGALVLLDEPETSLHPRAQSRLLELIAHMAGERSLQVVFATHSPYLTSGLPQEAVRVLERGPTGDVRVLTSLTAGEALHGVADVGHRRTIFVEDERAKVLVLSALETFGQHAKSDSLVRVSAGGTARIFQDMVPYALAGEPHVDFILDGDHRPTIALPTPAELPQGRRELEHIVSDLTRGPNRRGPRLAGLRGAAELTQYIRFFIERVSFLPGDTPEQVVWSDTAALQLSGRPLPNSLWKEQSAKERIRMLAASVPAVGEEAAFQFLAHRFLTSGSTDAAELLRVIRGVRARPVERLSD